jgi:hypothetical protein
VVGEGVEEEKEKNRELSETNVRVQRTGQTRIAILGGIVAASVVVVSFGRRSAIDATQQAIPNSVNGGIIGNERTFCS